MSDPLPTMILFGVLLTAVVMDIRSYRIPNLLTVPAMVCGLVIHFAVNGPQGLIMSLAGLVLGMIMFLAFYATGGMGAGDVKLMAAVGSFLGPLGALHAGVMTMLLGGFYAATTMVAKYGLRDSLRRMWTLLTTLTLPEQLSGSPAEVQRQYQLHYALAIGLGTVLSQMILVS
jgi:prepilin peptidase CpaA